MPPSRPSWRATWATRFAAAGISPANCGYNRGMELIRTLRGLFKIIAGVAGVLLGLWLAVMTAAFGGAKVHDFIPLLALVVAGVLSVLSGMSFEMHSEGTATT